VLLTFQATTEHWIDKYSDPDKKPARTDGKMTDEEVSAALDARGITEAGARIAAKVELQRAGKYAN
jgi:hypothetical protein